MMGYAVEGLLAELLRADHEVDPELIQNTPRRVARAWGELLSGYECEDPEEILSPLFPAAESAELVAVTHIPFYSMCAHHLLPFVGEAHIGYVPDASIVGLSKPVRLVEAFARRLQIQEQLTAQVAEVFDQVVRPRGCVVMIEAEHLCMTMRGCQTHGSRTVTVVRRGLLADPAHYEAFLQHVRRNGS